MLLLNRNGGKRRVNYRRLGKTGLKVSEICLGCMTFGGQADEETSIAIIDHALESGVNFLDTADVYTRQRSEAIVGKALKGRRDKVVLATKVRGRVGEDVNDVGLSRKHIMQGVEDSLRRLQTDYIDLYQVHSWDPETPIEETLSTLDDLVRQGKVRYIGCSNFAAWQLCKALWASDVHNWVRFDSIQPRYNILDKRIEAELLPLCADQGIGVVVYSPLAGGVLTGKYRRGEGAPEGSRFALRGGRQVQSALSDSNLAAVQRLGEVAAARGKSVGQLALAWVLANPTVSSAINGATSVAQFVENLGALEISLTEDELAACAEAATIARRG